MGWCAPDSTCLQQGHHGLWQVACDRFRSRPSFPANHGKQARKPRARGGCAARALADSTLVAPALRSERESNRGDVEVWSAMDGGMVGCDVRGQLTPKYSYDHVFPSNAPNGSVYEAMVRPKVAPALAGINGTIFAYGVTSGGKTHTMMGGCGELGMIPLMLQVRPPVCFSCGIRFGI